MILAGMISKVMCSIYVLWFFGMYSTFTINLFYCCRLWTTKVLTTWSQVHIYAWMTVASQVRTSLPQRLVQIPLILQQIYNLTILFSICLRN